MARTGRVRGAWAALLSVVATTGLVALPGATALAAEEVYDRPADGSWSVQGHGYGHGHGLSQWGAQGAATLGQSVEPILDAYYPGTARGQLAGAPVRIQLRGDEGTDTEVRAASGLSVTDLATGAQQALPSGPTRWRATVDAAGLHLSSLTGTTWTPAPIGTATTFAGPLRFAGPPRVRLDYPDGTSRDYRGAVQAARLSATTLTSIAVLPLEDYLLGVVPQEAYPSWMPAALQAQAVAARSYSAYQREHAGSRSYDLCDTTACQVFRGSTVYDAAGTATAQEVASTTAAVQATAGEVRTYAGATIFAEFSSSNGGWSTDGGQPYLVARQDDWDGAAPNTVHSWSAVLTADALEARFPAVGHLLRLRVTARDGHGEWGGRVTAVVLEGADPQGIPTSVTTTGDGIKAARPLSASARDGLLSNWWHLSTSYAATVASRSVAPRLVRPPGVTTGVLAAELVNTGDSAWPVSELHLATSTGTAQPLTGASSTPGRYVENRTHPGATSVLPGDRVVFSMSLDAAGLPAGSYAASYRVQLGSAAMFGPVTAWSVTLAEPVYAAVQGAAPALLSSTSTTSPALLRTTVVLPRNGATTVRLSARNTGNLSWPVGPDTPLQLGASSPRGRSSASRAGSWPAPDRAVGLVAPAPVAPGQGGTFDLELAGNGLAPGVTREAFEPEWLGEGWTGELTSFTVVRTDPAVPRLASLDLAPSSSLSLVNAPTGTRTLVLRLRNLGGSSWTVGRDALQATAPSALATSAWASSSRPPALAVNASRPGQASVQPGELGEWRIPVSGLHARPGTLSLTLRATYGGHLYGPAVTSKVTVVAARFTGSVVARHAVVQVPRRGTAATSYDVRNTGNVAWVVRGSLRSTVRAGSSPSRAISWFSASRPGSLSTSVTHPGSRVVRPGEVGRFVVLLAGNGRSPRTASEAFGMTWDGWRGTTLSALLSYRVV